MLFSKNPKSDTNLDETPLRKKLFQIFYWVTINILLKLHYTTRSNSLLDVMTNDFLFDCSNFGKYWISCSKVKDRKFWAYWDVVVGASNFGNSHFIQISNISRDFKRLINFVYIEQFKSLGLHYCDQRKMWIA